MNGVLLVDKPQGFTSHDVVAKLRGICHERRIGHSGTLDPMATGLLVVFVGRATRAVQFAENDEKEYLARLRCCLVTDTQDITGTVLETCEKVVYEKELLDIFPEFTGEISQLPPMYSAIKVKGQKLYDLARKGVEVEREPRNITIKTLELTGKCEGDFCLRVVCSKGTYIRTLCHDIGQRLGTGATLSALRRTRAGSFSVNDAHTLEEISKEGAEGFLLPVDMLFSQKPQLSITPEQREKCLCGNAFPSAAADGEYRVYGPEGDFLMLGTVENGLMSTVKSFFEV